MGKRDPEAPDEVEAPTKRRDDVAVSDLLGQLHRLAAEREAQRDPLAQARVTGAAVRGEPVAGVHLVIPAAEGVLLAEARALRRVPVADLHAGLRFDLIAGRFVRDLGPGVGALQIDEFDKHVVGVSLSVVGIPTFAALLERVAPVLEALGGMGPIVCALGTREPAEVREVRPIRLAEIEAALVPETPYGRRVYPCWLLGGPPRTRVTLDLSVVLADGRPSYGYRAAVRLV